jgi:hypothetical protein
MTYEVFPILPFYGGFMRNLLDPLVNSWNMGCLNWKGESFKSLGKDKLVMQLWLGVISWPRFII